ncbi:hypothetical protein BpHYR1_040683 [Brachionus plicatilis]|uniref:Uncharacterized protein n=1 Tax=Brachionus plicatilis TaxID=10195 RepID=A0A3M7PWC8_BRAPC|nr:hypothetical protein BpHYR1_040683 [Brachionus plicatilis]
MKSCKKSSFEISKNDYGKACGELKQKFGKVKSDYENRLSKIAKSDPKLIYAYVRSKMGEKEEIRMLRTKEGEVTSDKKLIAELYIK